MIDKVRPLKIEKAGDGTEIDPFPTETDPSEDYLASKGIALENSDATIIYGDSGVMKFKDTQKTTAHSLDNLLDAEYEDFDPTGTSLTSTKTGPAIRELAAGGGTGASPGFSFGRSGNVTSGSYLNNESVPSNVTGRPVDLDSSKITQISVSNELSNTFEIVIEEHDGTTYTELCTISLTAQRTKKQIYSVNVTSGKELAAKVKSGSCKNPVVTVYVKGDAV